MTTTEVLDALAAAGVTVRSEGGKLLLSPRDRITDDVRRLAAAHRAGLVTWFEERHGRMGVDTLVLEAAAPNPVGWRVRWLVKWD